MTLISESCERFVLVDCSALMELAGAFGDRRHATMRRVTDAVVRAIAGDNA